MFMKSLFVTVDYAYIRELKPMWIINYVCLQRSNSNKSYTKITVMIEIKIWVTNSFLCLRQRCNSLRITNNLAKEQYWFIIGPSKGSAIFWLSPSLAGIKEKSSGKHINFAPAETASYEYVSNHVTLISWKQNHFKTGTTINLLINQSARHQIHCFLIDSS